MIKLHNVLPHPLVENGLNPHSEVFNTEGVIFEPPKRYLVTAPSGKGKSTLLHAFYGLRNDFNGVIFLEEEKTTHFNADAWANIRQKKLAIVFQDLRLFLHLTVRDNIELKRQLYQQPETKNSKLEIQAPPSVSEVNNWVERLGMTPFLDKKCDTLSYGQRQRVAIIRALCQPFQMLLLDEPFSHLDRENIKMASEIIDDSCVKNKAGLILVSLGDKYHFNYDKQLVL